MEAFELSRCGHTIQTRDAESTYNAMKMELSEGLIALHATFLVMNRSGTRSISRNMVLT